MGTENKKRTAAGPLFPVAGGWGLRGLLDAVLLEYVREFERKQGARREFSVAGDLMRPALIADRFIDIADIVHDIDNGLPEGWTFDWYDARAEKGFEGCPDLRTYARARRAAGGGTAKERRNGKERKNHKNGKDMENTALKRESMVFFRSFHEALRPAPPELQAEVCMAVFAYAMDGEAPQGLTGTAEMAFLLIRPQVDANNRRWAKTAKGRAALAERAERERAETPPAPVAPAPGDDGTAMALAGAESRTETPTERPTERPTEAAAETPPDDGASIARARAAVPPPLRGTEGGTARPAPPPVPPDNCRKRPVRELLAECEGHVDWLAMVGMKNSLTAAEALRWLRAFALHLAATGRDDETMAEFKRYFANWTASEVRQGRSPVNAPPPRGADALGRAARCADGRPGPQEPLRPRRWRPRMGRPASRPGGGAAGTARAHGQGHPCPAIRDGRPAGAGGPDTGARGEGGGRAVRHGARGPVR